MHWAMSHKGTSIMSMQEYKIHVTKLCFYGNWRDNRDLEKVEPPCD